MLELIAKIAGLVATAAVGGAFLYAIAKALEDIEQWYGGGD